MENDQLSIKRYPAYKDSGVEWLGDIPEKWVSLRIKDLITKIDQGWSPNAENREIEEGEWGVLKLSAISNGKYYEKNHKALPDSTGLKHQYVVKKDDLLITRSNTPELVGDCCLVLAEPMFKLMYSDLIYCLRIRSGKISDKYLNYFLCSTSFRWLKTVSARGLNTSMVKISQGIICRWNIFSPPISEQKTIADYLDTKTAQIDRKIDLLTQKATLYSNLKQSLINETVTRGLDKTVPMSDRGIEWLGEVPKHWVSNRHKDNLSFVTKRCSDLALVKVGLENIEGKTGQHVLTDNDFDGDGIEFKKDDILFGKLRPYLAKVYLAEFKGSAVGDIFVYRSKSNTVPRFAKYLMLSNKYIDVINSSTAGAKMPRVSMNFIANLPVITPPLSEQKAIADYLDSKTAQIDQIIQTINTQIEKLKELRKTLINDVVTGKIKVT